MSLTLMGTKKGMMQAFDDEGNVVVCTVISAEPNIVSQIQTKKDKQLLQDCINITNQQKEFENNKNMHSNTLNDKEERLLYQYLFNMNTK